MLMGDVYPKHKFLKAASMIQRRQKRSLNDDEWYHQKPITIKKTYTQSE